MESKWGYQLTQKADADLDDIVGYIAVELQTQSSIDFADKWQETAEENPVFPGERLFSHQ